MSSKHIVKRIAQEHNLSIHMTQSILDSVLDELQDVFHRGDAITFTGFGQFTSVKRSARQGRNPRTGTKLPVPELRSVRFKPSRKLRERIEAHHPGMEDAPGQ